MGIGITMIVGKIYKLLESDEMYGSGREILGKFLGIEDDGKEVFHTFELSDGRQATVYLEWWSVQEGSELLWAMS
jgi:hypothetical protein